MVEKDLLLVGATVWVRVPSMMAGGYEDHRGVVSEILDDGSVNVVRESGEDINPQKPIANAQREIPDNCAPRDPVWGFFRGGSPQWLFGIQAP